MSSIFGTTRKTGRVGVSRVLFDTDTIQIGDETYAVNDLNSSIKRFNEFWELMETIKKHGYLRAAMSVVGRSSVGAWWTIQRHPMYGEKSSELQKKRLFEFYMAVAKDWSNIKDYQNFAFKLMIGVMYLRYFGQAAYQIVRNAEGRAVGLDFLFGMVVPNVDAEGTFKDPAFVQYPSSNPRDKVEFDDPRDIVFITNPDWEGSPMGGTDIEALSTYALPIDLYLQTAAREYLKNRDRPEVVYSLPPDVSDEAFDDFVKEVEQRWRGASNVGHSPITVQGEFEVHELGKMPDSLPYQDSRKDSRDEELSVAGVSGAKLGLSEDLSSANIREMRREFHETSMVPMFRLIELAFYEQVHVREFRVRGWEFKFNSPDFLTAVERATVHMRYYGINALNPNEIRYEIGKPSRDDEYGNLFADQLEIDQEQEEEQGAPPEGREPEPDDPSETGEPTLDDQDPPRGDQHDDETREDVLRDLRTWRNFAVKRMKSGKKLREFNSEFIPAGLGEIVQGYITRANDVSDIKAGFEEVMAFVREEW